MPVSQDDFQREVIDRLARIETKQDATQITVADNVKTIAKHSISIAEINASAKSAHHRIDGICATAGLLGGLAGTIANVITLFWPKSGGH
jgi:hypothetical protein